MPDKFCLHIHADLYGVPENGGAPVLLGFGWCRFFQVVRAVRLGEANELFYNHRSLGALARVLMNSGLTNFKTSVLRQFGLPGVCDMLILGEVFLMEEARGRGLGLLFAQTMTSDFQPSTGLVVTKPYPFMGIPLLKGKSEARACTALAKHWEKIGFKRVGRSGYWCRNPALDWSEPQWPESFDLDLEGKQAELLFSTQHNRALLGIPGCKMPLPPEREKSEFDENMDILRQLDESRRKL
jgi:hypothetical protein